MEYNTLASPEVLDRTIANLREHGFLPETVASAATALERIKELIPSGRSVMNGASRTLEQIGYIDYLKSDQHPWNNLHAGIFAETDPAKQAILRKQATISDFYLGSVHALAETGEIVIASNTGSQLPHIAFTSPNIIFVVGTNKIVPTLNEALARLEQHVVPLEDERMQQAYGMGTTLSKTLIFHRESPVIRRPRSTSCLFPNAWGSNIDICKSTNLVM